MGKKGKAVVGLSPYEVAYLDLADNPSGA